MTLDNVYIFAKNSCTAFCVPVSVGMFASPFILTETILIELEIMCICLSAQICTNEVCCATSVCLDLTMRSEISLLPLQSIGKIGCLYEQRVPESKLSLLNVPTHWQLHLSWSYFSSGGNWFCTVVSLSYLLFCGVLSNNFPCLSAIMSYVALSC